jgi:hypothetical protein
MTVPQLLLRKDSSGAEAVLHPVFTLSPFEESAL